LLWLSLGSSAPLAFEPNPSVAGRLARNIELNNFKSVANVEPFAAGEFDGQATFSFAMTEMQGRFADLPYVPEQAATVSVPCQMLDSYSRKTGLVPDLLLIDVEHAEGRVLRGMNNLLATKKPIIVIEMHGQEAIREAYAELTHHGYRLLSAEELRPVTKQADIRELGHYVATPPGFSLAEKIVP